MQCPSSAAVVPTESRFCLTCGQPLGTPSDLATIAAVPGAMAVVGPHVRGLASSDSVPVGGFTPGTILADRYRIIGLLGRGGMGEVYRTDDLKLGQLVALKFLRVRSPTTRSGASVSLPKSASPVNSPTRTSAASMTSRR